MVFVWLTAFFLVVALIVLVIYQVSAAPPNPYLCLGTRRIFLWTIPRETEAAVLADLHVVSVGLSVI